jgi:hypothetical protein
MFKAINYLLFEKRKPLDSEILDEFHPYMVGRYLSMYDDNFVSYVNDTLNTYGNLFDNKEDQFLFYENLIPKLKRKNIDYVKRKKVEKKDDEISNAIPEFLSSREIEEYKKIFG